MAWCHQMPYCQDKQTRKNGVWELFWKQEELGWTKDDPAVHSKFLVRPTKTIERLPWRFCAEEHILTRMMRSGVIAQAHSVEWVQRGRRAAETAGPCEWWQLSWNLFCDEQEASAIQTKQAWYDQSETFGPQRVQGVFWTSCRRDRFETDVPARRELQ